MFTVVATQKLNTEDFLLRFKAEASQDDMHGIRSTSVRSVLCVLNFFVTHEILFTCMSCFASFSFSCCRFTHVLCFPSDV